MAGATLRLRVVSPEATVFEGHVASVVVPMWDGQAGILPGHAPMVALLGGGMMEAEVPGGGMERFFLNRGVVKVEEDRVTILSEFAGAHAPEDFDPKTAWLDPVDLEVLADPGNPLI